VALPDLERDGLDRDRRRVGDGLRLGAARIYTVTIAATDISETTGGEVPLPWIILTGPPPFV